MERFVPQSEKLIIHFSNKRVKFRKKKVKRYKKLRQLLLLQKK
ncbi:tRNA modification GTPase mnmE domain protein [Phocaeicola vulgatus str. 3775 SL(B) 10 (iv)]|uniref:tRNA modification GTPase mnmE domain protein n=1 Tax=Phocaeicola vulgatus str. 3775 SL(B) 10 (iv) TaxID=1339350 RepID=A0A078RFH8_PHOVU|nr:tRNA modification GTPase mnmE domain protein [Phocaeicola vulgatus str. 3775 SR(B) 19]KDS32732.1 tRNA modification GTPase mnmE domain protein [Phocaeicola vulgatus str. 3775 SL(B) 10 (iv)]